MMQQYSSYGIIPEEVRSLIASNVSPLDSYVLMQTGENEYTGLIKNNASKNIEQIIIRNTDGVYTVSRDAGANFEYEVTNEYYVYSNCGVGHALEIPSYGGIQMYAIVGLCCLVFLMVVFKGALFKWLGKK